MREIRIVDGDADLRGLVRELAHVQHDSDGALTNVLTMYADVDPRTHPLAQDRIRSVALAMDEAERCAPDGRWKETISELRGAFATGVDGIDGARGLLVYAMTEGDLTMVRLPWPVEQEVSFDRAVHVRQLVRSLPTSSWCILLCNRRSTRIMLGDREHLEQVDAFQDEVDGKHDQGGWSQARFARNIEQQVARHLRHTVDVVQDLQRSGAFDCLLVAAPAEVRSALEAVMPTQLQRCMRGWIDVDVEHSSVADVALVAADAIRDFDDMRLERTLGRLRQNAGRQDRAVIGLDDVLEALGQQRVETLVVNDGFGHPGMVCPHGDWLAAEGGTCPTHNLRLQPCADVVELAIEHALRQDAHVTVVERDDPREPDASDGTRPERQAFQAMRTLGGISAIVRFNLTDQAGAAELTGSNA